MSLCLVPFDKGSSQFTSYYYLVLGITMFFIVLAINRKVSRK